MWGKIVFICLFVTVEYVKAKIFVITPQVTAATAPKTAGTVCKISVFCQIRLTKAASSVTVGGTPICAPTSARTVIATVDPGSTIAIVKNLALPDYFRAVITEIPNSCSTTPGKSECKVDTASLTGSVISPGFPAKYDNNMSCDYKFDPKLEYCGVSLEFYKFGLEKSSECTKDYLKMQGKPYCSNDLKEKTVAFKTPFNMTFKSDDETNGEGFIAGYKYLKDCDAVCNKKYTATAGLILSPLDDSGKYQSGAFCTFTIVKKPDAFCLSVTFTKLELNAKDYVLMDGIKYQAEKTPLEKKINFPEGKDSAEINFVSVKEDLPKKAGFILRYQQVKDKSVMCPAKRCAPVLTGTGTLKSPRYPQDYPKNYECEFQINKGDNMKTATIVLNDKLGTGDSLTITKGTTTPQELKADAGVSATFPADGPIVIKFASNGADETKFDITVIQLADNQWFDTKTMLVNEY